MKWRTRLRGVGDERSRLRLRLGTRSLPDKGSKTKKYNGGELVHWGRRGKSTLSRAETKLNNEEDERRTIWQLWEGEWSTWSSGAD